MNLKDKIVIVTGGSSGIGLGIAKRLSREGATVIIASRNVEEGEKASLGVSNSIYISTDVTQESSVQKLVEQVVGQFGKLDIVINSAGSSFDHSDITQVTEDQYNTLLDGNLKSVFLLTKHTISHLIKSSGNIVNISSQYGLVPSNDVSLYSSAKAAVVMFTKNIAKKYGPEGVRVNCVCPGGTRTSLLQQYFDSESEMVNWYKDPENTPLKRIGEVEDIANAVSFLVSSEASYITGAILSVDGGSGLV